MSAREYKIEVRFDEKKIDGIFKGVDQGLLPGAAVGIAIGGVPVYRKGFGLASMDLPLLLTPTMRMRIGSTSKQFTALAYMMLCEDGAASLDDQVVKHLPELHPITRGVTVRQLMGNTSGLRDSADIAVQFSGAEGSPVTAEQLVSLYRQIDDVNFLPGTAYAYNNGGWVILSAIIERLTERALEDVLWERVFKPVGMQDTMLRRWDCSFVSNSASCHTLKAGRYIRTEMLGGRDFAGAGAIVSSVDDMLRWMAQMDAPTTGTARTWELMKTPQRLANGTSTGYGLGLSTISYRGVETLQHAGGGYGSNAQMLKVPLAGLDIVVLVNRSDQSSADFANRIIDACLPCLDPLPEPYRGTFATGVFRSPKSGRVVELRRDSLDYCGAGELQVVAVDGHRLPFAPDEKGVLHPLPPAHFLNYVLKLSGDRERPSSIELQDFGTKDTLLPIEPATRVDGGRISGRYRSDSIGTDIEISATDANGSMNARGPFGSAVHRLECMAEGVWRTLPEEELCLPPWGLLSFEKDGEGFRFSNFMNRYLRFKRVG